MIFLLYGEDRNLLPSRADGQAQALYQEGYGVRALHAKLLADRARHPDTMEERRGAWGRLLVLFRLVHGGDGTGWIRSRGGKLFDPGAFPFLEGRDNGDDRPAPPHVTDGCMLRVLDGLLVLGGEKLSYRTLDVQHIGSVYETVMGFTVLAMPGPALAIKAGKNNRTPVFVDLAALDAKRGKEREKFLKDEADRSGQLPARVATALAAAPDATALAEALRPIVDERGSPHGPVPPGTPLLQPTDERRRTGSHYTPRSLTEPIVRHALEPALQRLGPDATPEQVLALKVCDPAMGSGAFLVEACRQLATRLVAAWTKHPGTRPPVAEDEDEDLLARRLVAQRCLYGVDRNPLAADLARLSLWLATLARDHEFTFLDHALKSGDSLVGLTARQIAGLRWQDGQSDVAPFNGFLRERIAQVTEGRRAIREAPDDVARAVQEQRFKHVEGLAQQVRLLGDAALAAFFGANKPRAREQSRVRLGVVASQRSEQSWPRVMEAAGVLATGTHPLHPFHWEIEFPEVFASADAGFDVIVGNPPFAGKNTLINGHCDHYLDWLQTLHAGAHGNADLVAHFFRRAFALLRPEGCFGLIATNTIGQGDTRESGLRAIIHDGGVIVRAERRLQWPGEAAVVVSVVHVVKGAATSPVLDGRQVRRINAYLMEGELDTSPAPLAANSGKAFQGSIVLGVGFTFDDVAAERGKSPSIKEMNVLIEKNPRNAEKIFPYIGGDEVNTDPLHSYRRFVINFGNLSEAEARAGWPDLMSIIERFVKPERTSLPPKTAWNRDVAARWWQFGALRQGLERASKGLERVLVTAMVSPHMSFTFLPTNLIYTLNLTVITFSDYGPFSVLQSRIHEVWARAFSSTLEDRIKYSPQDAFRTFPFPRKFCSSAPLDGIGEKYFTHRAALMVAHNEGLTKTYNRFHNPSDRVPGIQRLRELHHELDLAVLRAYGWDDLAARATPEFLTEETEPDHRYQGRLFWLAPFRDEVLARLLDLNRARAAEERALGLSPGRPDDGDEDQDEAA